MAFSRIVEVCCRGSKLLAKGHLISWLVPPIRRLSEDFRGKQDLSKSGTRGWRSNEDGSARFVSRYRAHNLSNAGMNEDDGLLSRGLECELLMYMRVLGHPVVGMPHHASHDSTKTTRVAARYV